MILGGVELGGVELGGVITGGNVDGGDADGGNVTGGPIGGSVAGDIGGKPVIKCRASRDSNRILRNCLRLDFL